VNQLAAQRALRAGTTVRNVLDCIREIRRNSQIPIVLYTYLNPVFQFGLTKFHREAEGAGVDGLLILDLPPEEDPAETADDGLGKRPTRLGNAPASQASNIERPTPNEDSGGVIHVRLIAPTTPPDRIVVIAKNARGFLYYVSREGVTGARDTLASSLAEKIAQLRKLSDLPIAVGFGISTADQAREVARYADAVVVGSAIVDLIAKHGTKPDLIERVGSFAGELAEAVKSV
jgi:tryptophan synthase alpha chain